jgi:hypothetical protein
MDVAATQACAVRAVPVALYEHGSAATGATSGQSGVHRGDPSKARQAVPRSAGIRRSARRITGLSNACGVS